MTTDDPLKPPRPGWQALPRENLPQPTYFPSGLAMGTTFMFWGVVTSLVIFLVGLALFLASLAGWLHEIHLERKSRK